MRGAQYLAYPPVVAGRPKAGGGGGVQCMIDLSQTKSFDSLLPGHF